MGKLTDYINRVRVNRLPQRTRANQINIPLVAQDENIRLKSRPVVETPTQLDNEIWITNYPDLYNSLLDHILPDLKGGNLTKEQEAEANYYLKCAVKALTWHNNIKNGLYRLQALYMNDIAGLTTLSVSRDGFFFKGVRTHEEKKQEKREMRRTGNSLLPGLGGDKNKEQEEKW